MRSTKLKIVRVPTMVELQLGTAPKQLEIAAGKIYDLAPHAELWMRGAKTVRVKYISTDPGSVRDWTMVGVAPIVNGQELRGKFLIPIDHFA